MAKFTKEVEAEQYDPKAESPKEVLINGASSFAYSSDYIVYENGQAVAVINKEKFEAVHKGESKPAKEGKK